MTERDTISLVASRARNWIEQTLPHFAPDYCGACAWASAFILKELTYHNIRAVAPVVVLPADITGHHVFVKTQKYIIDVTATQFQETTSRKYYPDVIVVEKQKAREFFWDDEDVVEVLKTPEEIAKHTYYAGWPLSQVPKLEMMENN